MTRTPAYRTVYSDIRRKISDGTYPVGSMIPTETQLQEAYGVSRTTIRKAISMLAQEERLSIRQGHGTVVLEKTTTQSLNSITTITTSLMERGFQVTVQGMSIDLVDAPEKVSKALHLDVKGQVYRIQRVLCADGDPVVYSCSYYRPDWLPGLEQYENTFVSIYRLFQEKYHILITEVDETISAAGCSFIDAQVLQIPQGTPILLSRRISSCSLGLLEYAESKILADKYEYSIHMQRQ